MQEQVNARPLLHEVTDDIAGEALRIDDLLTSIEERIYSIEPIPSSEQTIVKNDNPVPSNLLGKLRRNVDYMTILRGRLSDLSNRVNELM